MKTNIISNKSQYHEMESTFFMPPCDPNRPFWNTQLQRVNGPDVSFLLLNRLCIKMKQSGRAAGETVLNDVQTGPVFFLAG